MKKIFYIIMFVSIVSSVLSSCTEETVEPQNSTPAGGGVSDPKK